MDNCYENILDENYGDFIFPYDNNFLEYINGKNICYTLIDNIFAIAYLDITTLPKDMLQRYGYQVYPNCYGLMSSSSLEAAGITRTKAIPTLNLNGSGVLVAIIDTGIDYTHPAFIRADGTSKIRAIWDQTIQSGTPPQGYYFGTEYTMENINEALNSENPLEVVPTTDVSNHGTFLSGIACGTPNVTEQFSGIVPEAELVVVKLKPSKKFNRDFFFIPETAVSYQENDIMIGINYVLSLSRKYKKPISICLGFGSSQGPHDGSGPLARYLSTIAAIRGTAISCAAGNEGTSNHHYSTILDKNREYDTVELNVGPNVTGFSMEFWGDTPSTFSIDILSPTGEYVPRIPARLNESRVINFIFETTIIYVDYELIEAQTGDQLILVRFQNPTEGAWRFRVYASGDLSLRYHVWLPITDFLSTETFFPRSDPNCTLTCPGNATVPMSITAYNHTNNTIYRNASRGFSRSQAQEPDYAAPGVDILAPGLDNSYIRRTGTSAAAAFNCGVGAMFLEWGIVRRNYPTMDSIEIKNLLIRGAKRNPNQVYPNTIWGYGILDVFNTFNTLRGEPSS